MCEKNEYNNHSDLNEDDIEKILTIISQMVTTNRR